MMGKEEIIDALIRERVVETLVCNTAKRCIDYDLQDLVQMVYLAILEYDEDKLRDLYESGIIRFFIARIIMNQYNSSTSPYHLYIRKFAEKSEDIGIRDWSDE